MSRTSNGWTEFDEMEFRSQTTVYNGRVVTVAQACALRASDRKRKNEKAKKKKNQLYDDSVFPYLRDNIFQTFKSSRTLKSFKAFRDNGQIRWKSDYESLMNICPLLSKALYEYSIQYNKVADICEQIDDTLKRSKKSRAFMGLAEEFGIHMYLLLDRLNDIIKVIHNKKVTMIPGFKDKEIIIGSPDGKRIGIRQLLSMTTATVVKTKTNLVKLQRDLLDSYSMTFA